MIREKKKRVKRKRKYKLVCWAKGPSGRVLANEPGKIQDRSIMEAFDWASKFRPDGMNT